MKTKHINIIRLGALSLAGVMTFSVLVMPTAGFAAPKSQTKAESKIEKAKKAESIPKAFANKEVCVSTLQGYSLAKLKSYGNKRIDNRTKTVDKYPAKIQEVYKNYEKKASKDKNKVEDANNSKRLAVASNKVSAKYKENPVVKDNKSALLKEVSSTKNALDSKKKELDKATTPAQAAEDICYVFFDLRVYSYLDTKINAQLKIDTAKSTVARNQARYNATKAKYQANKDDKKYAKKLAKLESEINGLPDPANSSKSLEDLQNIVNSVSVSTINDGSQKKEELKAVITKAKGVSSQANSDSKVITTAYNHVNSAVKQKVAKKKTAKPQDNTGGAKYEAPGVLKSNP